MERRDTLSATLSLASDAPHSYRTYDYAGWPFVWAWEKRQPLNAFLHAGDLYPRDHRVYLAAVDVAFSLGYHDQAGAARLRGDSASADSLLAHARQLESR